MPAEDTRPEGLRGERAVGFRTTALAVVGLTGFAISQPVLSVLGDDVATLALHGVDGIELVLFALLVAAVPPILICVGLWLSTRRPRLGRLLRDVALGSLVALFSVQLAKQVGIETGWVQLVLAIGAGVAFVSGYERFAQVRVWASFTAVLPVLAMGAFLFVAPSSALLTTPDVDVERVDAEGLPNVVVIVLDELPTRSILGPDGEMDAARFPNLARFAGDASWYRHHTSLSPVTQAAVPSMLSGRLPTSEAPIYANHPDNLFTLLAPTHELEVLESGTALCPYASCGLAGVDIDRAGLSDLMDVTAEMWRERVALGPEQVSSLDDFAENVVAPGELASGSESRPGIGDDPEEMVGRAERVDSFIESLDHDGTPSLFYLHLMLPHGPFLLYPDGEPYGVYDQTSATLPKDDRVLRHSWNDWTARVSEQRHLLQATYADRMLGEVLEALQVADLYDDSVIVVTSDHGISFETRTIGRQVSAATIDAIAYSPLFIKAAGSSGGRIDDSNVMAIDLLPTIAALLGVEPAWETDGAPVGSQEVLARGGRKEVYDIRGLGGMRLHEILEFIDQETFPLVNDRRTGPLTAGSDDIAGHYDGTDIAPLLGQRIDDLRDRREGTVQVNLLDRLEAPGDEPKVAVLNGRVPGGSDGDVVVVAIDGVVRGGARLASDSSGQEGMFDALLPQGSLDDENVIQLALVEDGTVTELTVEA